MKQRGPVLTVAAVAVLGFILLTFNILSGSEGSPAPVASSGSPSATTSVENRTSRQRANAPAADTPSSPGTAPPGTTAPGATTVAGKPFPASADYVGTIPLATGGTMTVSITVKNDKAVAYACDGNSVETWLRGTASGGQLKLTGKNDARLSGSLDGTSVKGKLWIGAKQWDYTAAPVTAPAGIYVSDNGYERTSWIVDSSGNTTGVRRLADGTTTPAADRPLTGGALTDSTVRRVAGDSDVR